MKKTIAVIIVLAMALAAFSACTSPQYESSVPTDAQETKETEAPTAEPTAEPTVKPTDLPAVPTEAILTEVLSVPAARWDIGYPTPANAENSLRYYMDADIEAPADYCVNDNKLYVLDSGSSKLRCYDMDNGKELLTVDFEGGYPWACAWFDDALYVVNNDDVLRVESNGSYEKAFSIKDNFPDPDAYQSRFLLSMTSGGDSLILNYSYSYGENHADTANFHMLYSDGKLSVNDGNDLTGMIDPDLYETCYKPLLGIGDMYAWPLSQMQFSLFKASQTDDTFYLMKYFEDRAVLYLVSFK